MQQSRLLCDIGESAVAVVTVQDVLRPAGDKEILEAVVVVVTDGDAEMTTPGAPDPPFR